VSTRKDLKDLLRLIAKISAAATLADELQIEVANGGLVGCVLGSLADELSVRAEAMTADLTRKSAIR